MMTIPNDFLLLDLSLNFANEFYYLYLYAFFLLTIII